MFIFLRCLLKIFYLNELLCVIYNYFLFSPKFLKTIFKLEVEHAFETPIIIGGFPLAVVFPGCAEGTVRVMSSRD